MNERIVLDASALLALIQQEPGSEVVKSLLHKAVISTVNLAEVLTVLKKLSFESDQALDLISSMVKNIIPFTVEQCKLTADLYIITKSKGLSLGDRACLALAMTLQAPVYTADRIWNELNLLEVTIYLIR